MVKIQATDNSETGSYVFGKNWIYHMIPHVMRVLKMYILLGLEMLRVKSSLGTLCTVILQSEM